MFILKKLTFSKNIRISSDNTFSCNDKNLKIEILFINKECKNLEGEKILFNKTVEVFLSYDNFISNEQTVFDDKKCTFYRM